jgi:hypothetical protein
MLRRLCVSDDEMTELPERLNECCAIEKFYITRSELMAIPDFIAKWRCLKSVSFFSWVDESRIPFELLECLSTRISGHLTVGCATANEFDLHFPSCGAVGCGPGGGVITSNQLGRIIKLRNFIIKNNEKWGPILKNIAGREGLSYYVQLQSGEFQEFGGAELKRILDMFMALSGDPSVAQYTLCKCVGMVETLECFAQQISR